MADFVGIHNKTEAREEKKKRTNYSCLVNILFCFLSFFGSRRGEWPSGLNSFRQVTKVKFGRVRSNSGCVTLEA